MPPHGRETKETTLNACTKHDWTEHEDVYDGTGNLISRTWFCSQCPEAVAACHTCGGPCDTANLACTKCVQKSHQTLEDIALALSHPMAPLLPLRAIRYDHSGRSSADSMPFGIGNELDDPDVLKAEMARTNRTALELTRDRTTLMDALDGWADSWAETVQEQRGETIPTLKRLTTWAINNPNKSGWHDYLRETKTVRHRLYTIVGLNPEKETIPCPYCGSTLIRRWTHSGLADEIRCTQKDKDGNPIHCDRKTYEDEATLLRIAETAIMEAPREHPNTLVTREQARLIYPELKRKTLNKWIERGHITPTGRNHKGQDLLTLNHITQRIERETP